MKEIYTRLPYHRDGAAFSQAAADEPATSHELDYLLPDLWFQADPNHKWTIDDIHPRAPIPTGSQPLAGGRAKRHHRMTR